jgi:hypothetical protein
LFACFIGKIQIFLVRCPLEEGARREKERAYAFETFKEFNMRFGTHARISLKYEENFSIL